jgi:hypothetical protein
MKRIDAIEQRLRTAAQTDYATASSDVAWLIARRREMVEALDLLLSQDCRGEKYGKAALAKAEEEA